jgi:hypothetical protein
MRLLLAMSLCCLSAEVLAQGVYPPVVLSDEHAAQVLVGVGSMFPDVSVTHEGETTPLAQHFGAAGTVVVVAGELDRQTKTLLRDLTPDVVSPYAKRNLNVLVVAVGDPLPADQVVELGYQGTVFNDPQGAGFALLGDTSLPRVYLLDAKGKIVWFDIEYSQSTRRELATSMGVLLPAK